MILHLIATDGRVDVRIDPDSFIGRPPLLEAVPLTPPTGRIRAASGTGRRWLALTAGAFLCGVAGYVAASAQGPARESALSPAVASVNGPGELPPEIAGYLQSPPVLTNTPRPAAPPAPVPPSANPFALEP